MYSEFLLQIHINLLRIPIKEEVFVSKVNNNEDHILTYVNFSSLHWDWYVFYFICSS